MFDKRQADFVLPLKKNRFYTGLTIFLALMLGSFFVVALATFNSKTDDRQRAAVASGVTITFAPLSTSLAVNQSMQIPIHLDTAGKAIAVAEILPSFDTAYFEAVSLTSASDTLNITQQQKTATNGQKKTRWITSLSQPDATLTGSTIVGAMYKTPGTGRLAVHECYFDGWDDYIFTTSSSATRPATFCPNTTANWKETYKGVVGYVMATKADTTLKPMQGCYDEPNNNHYYVTVENGCTAGTRTESIIGWIAPQDNSSLLTNTLVPAKVNTDGSFTSLVVAKPISIPPTGDIGSGNIAILTLKPKKAGTTTVSFNQTRTRAPEFKGAPSNIIATFQPITFTIAGDAPPPPPPPNDAQAACTQSGGTWKNLPSACVDTCASQTGEAICAAVITPGCDCGSAKCTNASGSCVANPAVPPPAQLTCVSTTISPTSAVNGTTENFTLTCGRVTGATKYKLTYFDNSTPGAATTKEVVQPATGNPSQVFKVNLLTGHSYDVSCIPCSATTCAEPTIAACKATFSLTAAPPPEPPSTASAFLTLQFKQQGLRKAGVSIPATVTVSYTATGAAEVIKQYSKTYTSTTSGVLASSTALPLEGITLTGPIPNAQVFVKTATTLNKKIGTVTINRGTTSLLTTAELMVGDFNQDGAQLNLFNILDISKMLTQYKMLDNPLNDTNRAFDINFDNTFNILDTSLVLSNFEALEKEGETP